MQYLQILLLCLFFIQIISALPENIQDLSQAQQTKKPLTFTRKGIFRILQFTDTHFSLKNDNLLNMSLMTFLLARHRPNFAVASGDLVSAYDWDRQQPNWYKKQWRQFNFPFQFTKTKYAVILGNHDSQGDLNRDQIMDLDATSPLSYSSRTQGIEGSNYYIPIYSKLIPGKIATIIWFFDSHDTGCDGAWQKSYGCVEKDQIEWFDKEYQKIYNSEIQKFGQSETDEPFLSIAFIHIPIPEFVTVYDTQAIYGTRLQGVGCPLINTGIFQYLVQNKIRAVFSGHDHNNDYHGWLEGVNLVFSRKTGFGSYGPPVSMKRGGRLIKLKEIIDAYGNYIVQFEHVIITSDGRKVKQKQATLRTDKIGECFAAEVSDRKPKIHKLQN